MAVLKVLFVLCFMRVVIVSAVGESGNCGDPPTSQKAVLDTNLDAFPVDTPLTYSCRPGYIWDRSSSRKVTCQKDLTWTELKITCNPKSCGSLPDISHGQIQYSDGIGFGSTAHMSCDPGYNIVGRNQRVCLADGWDHQNPVCEPKSCGSLPDISHGQIQYSDGIGFGSTAHMSCDPGYNIVGRNQRVCLADGWDHQNPVCEPVMCDAPPEIADGTFELPSSSQGIEYQAIAIYKCKKFQLIGKDTIHCTASGTWSDPPPVCKDVKCPDPQVVNGKKTSNFRLTFRYMESVTFTCNVGYQLNGSSTITCQKDNTWDPKPPTCEEGCGNPPKSQKAAVDINLNAFPVDTTLTYSCLPDYIWDRSSSNRVICQKDLTWTELKINCTRNTGDEDNEEEGAANAGNDNKTKDTDTNKTNIYLIVGIVFGILFAGAVAVAGAFAGLQYCKKKNGGSYETTEEKMSPAPSVNTSSQQYSALQNKDTNV